DGLHLAEVAGTVRGDTQDRFLIDAQVEADVRAGRQVFQLARLVVDADVGVLRDGVRGRVNRDRTRGGVHRLDDAVDLLAFHGEAADRRLIGEQLQVSVGAGGYGCQRAALAAFAVNRDRQVPGHVECPASRAFLGVVAEG